MNTNKENNMGDNADDFLRKEIRKVIPSRFKSQTELAELVGITQGNLSQFLAGKRGFSFDTAFKLLHVLGIELSNPSIKRTDVYSSTDIVTNDKCSREVPVYDLAGAGDYVDFNEFEVIDIIKIPQAYYRIDLKAVQVIGDSMEPFIKKGSFVGVIPFDGQLNEGHVYLICRPNWGMSIKRVFLDENSEIILHSDNEKYKDQKLSFEGYENIIRAKVVWVLQDV